MPHPVMFKGDIANPVMKACVENVLLCLFCFLPYPYAPCMECLPTFCLNLWFSCR